MDEKIIRLFIRVFKKRIQNGESFEDVAESYPKLTDEELEFIRRGVYEF